MRRAKPKPKIGISACLLGRCVRYDGGNKRQAWLVRALGKTVTFVPVCPELECGLGVPRDPMRLMGNSLSPRLVVIRTGKDVTAQMSHWMCQRLKKLEREHLDGFVFKSKSPTCGARHVRVFSKTGKSVNRGAGLFTRAFRRRFPHVPVTEEQSLRDPRRRKAFLAQLIAD